MIQETLTKWFASKQSYIRDFLLDPQSPYVVLQIDWGHTPITSKELLVGDKVFQLWNNYFIKHPTKNDIFLFTPGSPHQPISMISANSQTYKIFERPKSFKIIDYKMSHHEYNKEILAAILSYYQEEKTPEQIALELDADPIISREIADRLKPYEEKGLPSPHRATHHKRMITDPSKHVLKTTYHQLGLTHARGELLIVKPTAVSDYDYVFTATTTNTPLPTLALNGFLEQVGHHFPSELIVGAVTIRQIHKEFEFSGLIQRRYLLIQGPLKSEVYAAKIHIPHEEELDLKQLKKPFQLAKLALNKDMFIIASTENEPLPYFRVSTPIGIIEAISLPHKNRVAVIHKPKKNKAKIQAGTIKAPITIESGRVTQTVKLCGLTLKFQTTPWVAKTIEEGIKRVKRIETIQHFS